MINSKYKNEQIKNAKLNQCLFSVLHSTAFPRAFQNLSKSFYKNKRMDRRLSRGFHIVFVPNEILIVWLSKMILISEMRVVKNNNENVACPLE